MDRLRYNVLLETLTDDEFASLKSRLRERHFDPGDTILEEESHGAELFLIAEGRVSISRGADFGGQLWLALLHPGDFFGELELIDGRSRSAHAVAADSCTLYALGKDDFEQLLLESHGFTRRLLQVVSVRLRATNNQVVREVGRCREAARSEIGNLEQLVEASKHLNSTLNLEEVLDRILETALRIVDGDRGTVYVVEEKRRELWSRVVTGTERFEIRLPLGKGIAGYVAATGETLNIPDAYVDQRFNPEVDRRSGYRTRTILCMPMRNKSGKVIGVFQLLNKRKGKFSKEDEQCIEALSVHAAIAIENARLYASEREMAKLEKMLVAAREVQRMLLPRELPAVSGFELAASTTPAEEVGGDLFDFIPMDDGSLAFCLGDVSGKGLPASLLMANMQATVRGQAPASLSPGECLRRTNRLLYLNTTSEKFVTAFYGVIDPESGSLSYSNAGQDKPLLLSPDGAVEALEGGGIMLGITDDFLYPEMTAEIPAGSALVVYTDGVTEAENGKGEMFGEQRLRDALRRLCRENAEGIRLGVLAALEAFTGDVKQGDDITVLVMRRSP
jgi:sigma-B regulation protein RsbU (phosphoserine phosphatase)